MQIIPIQKVRATNSFYVGYVKTSFDLFFVILIFLAASLLFILIPLLICIDSKGPALFRQTRIGKDGKEFQIYKFRTMHVYVPEEGVSPKHEHDPRITRVGKFLRKTSLDELPQLFNIIKGEMSFVGPRPEQKSIVEWHYTSYEKQRLLVKPGITGLWQISMDRKKPIHVNLHHDFQYISDISFLLDLKIICKTVAIMFKSNTC